MAHSLSRGVIQCYAILPILRGFTSLILNTILHNSHISGIDCMKGRLHGRVTSTVAQRHTSRRAPFGVQGTAVFVLIILSLNLYCVSEVQWDNAAQAWGSRGLAQGQSCCPLPPWDGFSAAHLLTPWCSGPHSTSQWARVWAWGGFRVMRTRGRTPFSQGRAWWWPSPFQAGSTTASLAGDKKGNLLIHPLSRNLAHPSVTHTIT